MAHLKRYQMPGFWPLARKRKVFVVKPMPGPHSKENCIPLQIIVRDVLNYARDSKEAKKILNEGKILVDKKARKDPKFPVGLMDAVEIPEAKQYLRVSVNQKGLFLQSISEKDSKKKLCRIIGKTTVKGGLRQINLHDGRNILVKKDVYRVGDSLTLSLPDQKILKHHRFMKGEKAIVIAGKNIGVKGRINEIQEKKNMLENAMVILETKAGKIQTLKGYILVGEI